VGPEVILGGEGSDTFVFAPFNGAAARLSDFRLNEDFLKFEAINPAKYTDVYVNGMLLKGTDTVLVQGEGGRMVSVDDGASDNVYFNIDPNGSLSVSFADYYGNTSIAGSVETGLVGIDTVTEYRSLFDRIILG
jgi:hypothetical protein